MGIPWSLPPFVCVCLCVSNSSCPTLCDPMDCSPPGPSVHGILQTRLLSNSSCPTLCDPMDCSPPGSSVHGILQTRLLEWMAIPFFRGSSWPRDQTQVYCIVGRFFTIWATQEAHLLLRTRTLLWCPVPASIPSTPHPTLTFCCNFQVVVPEKNECRLETWR